MKCGCEWKIVADHPVSLTACEGQQKRPYNRGKDELMELIPGLISKAFIRHGASEATLRSLRVCIEDGADFDHSRKLPKFQKYISLSNEQGSGVVLKPPFEVRRAGPKVKKKTCKVCKCTGHNIASCWKSHDIGTLLGQRNWARYTEAAAGPCRGRSPPKYRL